MIIIGGSYQEICREPNKWEICGSGIRAAAALSGVCKDLILISAISPQEKEAVFAMLSGLRLSNKLIHRDKQIRFCYDTPLSIPMIDGIDAKADPIEAEGKVALVFGMIETSANVKADTIVFDPQKPRGLLSIDREKLISKRFAVVANAAETNLLGKSENPLESAKNIIKEYNADVVIVKRGAFGAIVVTKEMAETVDVHVTKNVWPLGSGDVFSAIFAWNWGTEGKSALESAKLASLGTAYYCSKRSLPIPLLTKELDKISNPLECDEKPEVQVYLAGPFFNISERWLVNLARDALLGLGAKVFSPLHDVGMGKDETAMKDILGLKTCNSVLALLDNSDPGTIFEVGYSTALDIPVIGFCEHSNSPDYQMIRGLGIPILDDFSSCIYNAIWAGLK